MTLPSLDTHQPNRRDAKRPRLIAFTGVLGAGKGIATDWAMATFGSGLQVAWADALKIELYDFLYAYGVHHPNGILPRLRRALSYRSRATVALPEHMPKNILDLFRSNTPKDPALSDQEKILWINMRKQHLRPLLQWWGTEYRRASDTNYWVRIGSNRIAQAINSGDHGVIVSDDCRFANEIAAVKDLGFTLVRIETAPEVQEARIRARDGAFDPAIRNHASETSILSFPVDHVIVNDGSLEDFHKALEHTLRAGTVIA